MLTNIVLIMCWCAQAVNSGQSVKVSIHKSELSDEQKNQALGIALLELENGNKWEIISNQLVTYFNSKYGAEWVAIIGQSRLALTVKSQPNTLLWFSFNDTQVLLFKIATSGDRESGAQCEAVERRLTPKQLIDNAKLAENLNNITIRSEMNGRTRDYAVTALAQALNAYDNFDDIVMYLTETMDTMFGPYWHTIIGENGLEANLKFTAGSYANIMIGRLQTILFQTNQPQYKTDFATILSEAKESDVLVHTENNANTTEQLETIISHVLSLNYSNFKCARDYHRNVYHLEQTCYAEMARITRDLIVGKFDGDWSVTVGELNFCVSSLTDCDQVYDLYYDRMLFRIARHKPPPT